MVAGRPGRTRAQSRLIKNHFKNHLFALKNAPFHCFFDARQMFAKVATKIANFKAQLASKTRSPNLRHMPTWETTVPNLIRFLLGILTIWILEIVFLRIAPSEIPIRDFYSFLSIKVWKNHGPELQF